MATFALIHGGGSSAWDWHRVAPLLERAGHDAIAVDLPIEHPDSQLADYVSAVAGAVGDRDDVIVVGHSLGGFTAPLACDAVNAVGLVYLTAMIPMPGETFEQWWTATGHDQEAIPDDPAISFFEDVPPELVAEATARERDQQGAWMSSGWPAERHPDVPTMGIVARDDRFFPASFMRRQIRERLGVEPVEVPGGHYVALTQPEAVAAALLDHASEIAAGRGG